MTATYWVKKFDNREAAFVAMRDIGFKHLAEYEGEYYYFSLQENDKFFTGMAEFEVDSEKWNIVQEKWNHFKMYRLVFVAPHNLDDLPYDINYKTGLKSSLYPLDTYVRGRLTERNFMLNAHLNAYGEKEGSDLFVKETRSYTTDAGGFLKASERTIDWMLEDGTIGGSKTLNFIYDNRESREEGKNRRRTVMSITSMAVVGLLVQTVTQGDINQAVAMGVAFIDKFKLEADNFVELATDELRQAFLADTETPWLDIVIDANGTTIRHYIANELV